MFRKIKDFLRWRKIQKRVKECSRCYMCAYNGDQSYDSMCLKCKNGVDNNYYTFKLRPITDKEFADIIIDNFLGKNWYVVDPLSREHVLAVALDEILKK